MAAKQTEEKITALYERLSRDDGYTLSDSTPLTLSDKDRNRLGIDETVKF